MDGAVLERYAARPGAKALIMPRHPHPLRAQFEAELLAHIKAKGDAFDRPLLVQQYVDVGVGASTVWRWIAEILRLGRVARRPGVGAKPRAKPPQPAAEAADAPVIAPTLPRVPSIDDVKTMGLVPVLELLWQSIKAAQELMAHGRDSDGKVRNARLIASGAEHLRRAVETAAKLNETVAVQQEMQAFHRIVMEEIAAEPPLLQERILLRIRHACDAALAD
jgi:hypothetical protein